MAEKRHWLYRFFRFVWHSIWSILLSLYLFALLGAFLSGWQGVPFAPFATIFPILFLGLSFVFLDSIRARNRRFITLSSVMLLLSLPLLWIYCPLGYRHDEEKGAKDLKLISYNVGVFRYDRWIEGHRSGLLDYLNKADADIVALQEATLQPREAYGLTEKQLRRETQKVYPYYKRLAAQGNRGSQMALLSKYPIKRAERLPLSSLVNGGAAYYLDIEGKETLVINLHLESFKLKQPYEERLLEDLKRSFVSSVKLILRSNILHAYYKRNQQIEEVVDYIEQHAPEGRVIVMGDFNATPTSYPQLRLTRYLTNAFAQSGRGLGISFRSGIFFVRIDNIFLGEAYSSHYTEVDHSATFSDHYPIWSLIKQND